MGYVSRVVTIPTTPASVIHVSGGRYLARVSPRSTRSLPQILAQVERERDSQARYFDQLDAKAGVTLGFAGILVALGPSGSWLVDLGRLGAAVSGLLALLAFWPRRYPGLDIRELRNLYLAAEPTFTELHVLDVQIKMTEDAADSLKRKAMRLKVAMLALISAALLTATGLALD